jgi:hypothetical protein
MREGGRGEERREGRDKGGREVREDRRRWVRDWRAGKGEGEELPLHPEKVWLPTRV